MTIPDRFWHRVRGRPPKGEGREQKRSLREKMDIGREAGRETGRDKPKQPLPRDGEAPPPSVPENSGGPGSGWSPAEPAEAENGELAESEKDLPGEETGELPEEDVSWDGSEAELVMEEDAAEYEIPQTGIRLSCRLKLEEAEEALKRSGFTKTMGRRAVVDLVILGVLAVLFLGQYFWMQVAQALFFAVVAVLCMGLVAFVPWIGRRRLARRICEDPASGHVCCVVYPDALVLGEGERQWEIPLDGSCRMEEYKQMLLLFPAGRENLVILPLRCVEPSVLPEVQAILEAGTVRKDEG